MIAAPPDTVGFRVTLCRLLEVAGYFASSSEDLFLVRLLFVFGCCRVYEFFATLVLIFVLVLMFQEGLV